MAEKIGRYAVDLIKRLTRHQDILPDLIAKPRGANNNKDGRAFELAYSAYLILLEIAAILRRGIENPAPLQALLRLSYNDRPICLVDDSHLVGLVEETYAQLKRGGLKWREIEHDFSRQIDLDAAHGLRIKYRLVLGKPRDIEKIQESLEKRGLGVVVAKAYDFPPEYIKRVAINPDLHSALETITGTAYPEWMAAVYGVVINEVEQSRTQMGFVTLVRRLHEDRPHLFHPLEEQHSYDFLLGLMAQVAPDVHAEICGPTLKLSEEESRDVYTIPWGNDVLVESFASSLRDYEEGDADDYLNLADVQEMLRLNHWERAIPRVRCRAYIDMGAEA
ncbi:hypothetical protein [Rhizobium anhuiense]|uniref:Uncharacterized protein n=1 Tax=Rhizobium anhuiense TaxID=1184720 RepID=A0A3S0RXW2_9HYPH|nr:hypothetical protein [Rhizobium anhuiense]RUL96136.1 hypothetical protein EEQ99_32270 [Rhizobium anhuiense]GGE10594.1 hypothetical protein GCM10008012_61600 [Rhizobium anhuiense]